MSKLSAVTGVCACTEGILNTKMNITKPGSSFLAQVLLFVILYVLEPVNMFYLPGMVTGSLFCKNTFGRRYRPLITKKTTWELGRKTMQQVKRNI